MAFAKKKVDLISDRSRALNEQIAALESEIQKLDTQLQRAPAPKFRSTAIPYGVTVARAHESAPLPPPQAQEPVFEKVNPLRDTAETATPDQFNELGIRKYDLPALFNRIRNHFRRPTTSNPRLVAYLAAGGVHGLRPMRYEKRVARNRFIFFAIILFVILFGTICVFMRSH
jgi:cell division protein FtsB